LNGLEEGTVLRLDWEDVPEAWLEIDLASVMNQIQYVSARDSGSESDEDDAAQPAYSDFATLGDPKYSPVQYGAYAAWFRGPETEPMPPLEAYGPEPREVA
jgi:hypothetical protein